MGRFARLQLLGQAPPRQSSSSQTALESLSAIKAAEVAKNVYRASSRYYRGSDKLEQQDRNQSTSQPHVCRAMHPTGDLPHVPPPSAVLELVALFRQGHCQFDERKCSHSLEGSIPVIDGLHSRTCRSASSTAILREYTTYSTPPLVSKPAWLLSSLPQTRLTSPRQWCR